MTLSDKEFFSTIKPMFGSFSQSQVDNFNVILGSQFRTNLIAALIPSTTKVVQRLSTKGAEFIALWEGIRLKAYKDTGGVWTIGIGTILYPNGVKVKEGDTCTKDQAYAWFKDYIVGVEDLIHKTIKVPLNQNQFDALVSLIYNIGSTQFVGGTVDDKLNAGNTSAAIETWKKYRFDNGKVVSGLVNRRNAEVALFLS